MREQLGEQDNCAGSCPTGSAPAALIQATPGLIAALVLGLVAFLLVVGPRALNAQNLAWLEAGGSDPITSFIGWHFYRHAPWSFPLGLNPNYGLELGNAIVYSDSIPLLALPLKAFSSWMPETFQYLGWWLLGCFLLQAVMGWKLAGLLSARMGVRLPAAGLFVFAPPMLLRMPMHPSLAAHGLVLAALYFCLRSRPERPAWLWLALLVLAALVHAYLFAICAALWLADLSGALLDGQIRARAALREMLAAALCVLLVAWQAGYFSIGSQSAIAGGYGLYRMNGLSFIDPSGYSWLVPDIPERPGDYEGFNYLGLGALALFLGSLLAPWLQARAGRATDSRPPMPLALRWRRHAPLGVMLVALWLFALSHQVGVGPWQFELPLPDVLLALAGGLRASGRMAWPLFYVLLFALLALAIRRLPAPALPALLSAALLAQVADTSAGWLGPRERMAAPARAALSTPLQDPFWAAAARHYQILRLLPPMNLHPDWADVAPVAARYRLITDATYLARTDQHAQAAAQRHASDLLSTGAFARDTLYVLEDHQLNAALFNADSRIDLVAIIDGVPVVAPGWLDCPRCPQDWLPAAPRLPALALASPLAFGRDQPGKAYLISGWSNPEPWGVWSDGPSARLVLPLPLFNNLAGNVNGNARPATPTRLRLTAGALVESAWPAQRLIASVNGEELASVTLRRRDPEAIDIPLPPRVLAGHDWLDLRLNLPDAVAPAKLAPGATDQRALGLALISLTLF
ncbi:hypothetical protein Thiowin_00503 [Thiorhodovibrio winogradskyi]|uniref:YfhO family protein n=1 Tax=Thiorhodovibrio winogradskyi TaxID=77007 RepID=A0ABZ0S5R2_9GAMM|nr:DUF6311 domain-containing protein [Thiorhodovibrio winogradskyi]